MRCEKLSEIRADDLYIKCLGAKTVFSTDLGPVFHLDLLPDCLSRINGVILLPGFPWKHRIISFARESVQVHHKRHKYK